MASASSMNGGLYIFGGFGLQQSSQNYNPYLSYGAVGLDVTNYNYATPPNFMQNPTLMNNPNFINNPNYNPLSGTGYNNDNKYNDNDDTVDENYYPVEDAWFLSYGYVLIGLFFLHIILFFDQYKNLATNANITICTCIWFSSCFTIQFWYNESFI